MRTWAALVKTARPLAATFVIAPRPLYVSLLVVQRVKEVAATRGESLELAHGWVLRVIEPVTLESARAVLAEAAAAVPASAAARIGELRIFAVPFISCQGKEDFIAVQRPEGELHSSVWLEKRGGTDLFLAFFDVPEHDVGFELLAAVAELVLPQLTGKEFETIPGPARA